MANEHVINNNLIITGSVTSSVGFFGDGSGLTGITAVAEWDGSRNGDASITGSFIVSGSSANVDFTSAEAGVSGSFSGSFEGDGSGLTNVSATLPTGVVSGSAQISYTGITDVPSGIVSSSAQFNSLTDPFSGSFTGSFTGDGSGLTDLTLPSGLISGSVQISYTGITDVPANIISSSAQFTTLTSPFTGSFTGSFTGDGSGLTGITATATGVIFQTGSNTGAIKTNDTSYTSIASGQYSFAGGGRHVTASADYATALGGFGTQATAIYATIIGGATNDASGVGSIVGGGVLNNATAAYSTIVGGRQNDVSGVDAGVFGGRTNAVSNEGSVVAGGCQNTVSGIQSGIVGGCVNSATGPYSNVFGGCCNIASSTGSVILGGSNQTTDRDDVVVVNNLYVTGSGTDASANYTGVIQVARRSTNPTDPKQGMLMVSGSDGSPNLYFYTSGGWVQIN